MFEKGDPVIYIPTGEKGIVTSVNQTFAFVNYGNGETSQATKYEDLKRA